ncbi:MAG: hypothetical protein NZ520_05045 [bacterium]|nr:hypothetical protein [bacterium]
MENEELPDVLENVPDDRIDDYHIGYRLLLLDLEQALRDIPDGLLWLRLALEEQSAYKAARRLKHGGKWLRRVQQRCRDVLQC